MAAEFEALEEAFLALYAKALRLPQSERVRLAELMRVGATLLETERAIGSRTAIFSSE